MTDRTKTLVALLVGLGIGFRGCWPAVHSFVTFGTRGQQAEAKAVLKALCVAQQAFIADRGTGTTRWHQLGNELSSNRYAYFSGPGDQLQDNRPRNGHLGFFDEAPNISDPDAVGLQPAEQFVRDFHQTDLPEVLTGGLKVGANGESTPGTWVIAAVANIDLDPEFDLWSVATAPRTAPDGKALPACVPFHEHDDVEPDFFWQRPR